MSFPQNSRIGVRLVAAAVCAATLASLPEPTSFAFVGATSPQQAASNLPTATGSTTFVYVADHKLKSVSVAGSFNGWNRDANPMHVDSDGVTWRLALPLAYGKYEYKFVVDGVTWVTDPAAKAESDGNGNDNSVLVVLPDDYGRPARPDDGVIARSALLHGADIEYVNYDRGSLILALRARPNDLASVTLLAGGRRFPARQTGEAANALYTRWIARVPWDRKSDLSYTFELIDGARAARFGASGLQTPGEKIDPFVVSAKTFQPFVVPAWVEKSVIYQIFPDRFADGDKSNDPPDVMPWNAQPTYYNRFGGDVAGVEQHLDYLSGLGVSAVYFNPVFESPSNHRYDATDYKKIDPQFGTNDAFAQLTRAMDRRGIRTVMDFAFNHTATNAAPFADVRKNGADSSYKDWYFIHSFPVHGGPNPSYEAWYGFESMPKLNVMNPATTNYLLGVADYWETEIPLGGMRLDAANEVDPRFWRLLRKRVKADNPQTWIVGEVWGDASPWLGGDQWDSVMDYPFRAACIDFIADGKTKPSAFGNRLMALYDSYAPQVSRNLMNLLSSHDTPRFLTLCKGDGSLDRLAAAIQFTWPGTPSIYYGEELGMEGGKDPDDRRGMRWDLANDANPMLRYYRRLIAARNASRALQSGDPQILMADDAADTFAYARVLGDDAAVVVINRADTDRSVTVTLPAALRHKGTLVEAVTGKTVAVEEGQKQLTLALPARSAAVLLPARGDALKLMFAK